jgi:proline iminopeptidase
VYTLQGPSEFGIADRLANWDIKGRAERNCRTHFVVGFKHDTMDPKQWKSKARWYKGSYLYCPNGSHLAMWDDQKDNIWLG